MKKITYLLLVSFILFVSCSNTDKSIKFVGIWKSVSPEHTFGGIVSDLEIIIKNIGSNFTVQKNDYPSNQGETMRPEYGDNYSASYNKENDKLVVNISGMSVDLIYDTKSDHILYQGKEYQKAK